MFLYAYESWTDRMSIFVVQVCVLFWVCLKVNNWSMYWTSTVWKKCCFDHSYHHRDKTSSKIVSSMHYSPCQFFSLENSWTIGKNNQNKFVFFTWNFFFITWSQFLKTFATNTGLHWFTITEKSMYSLPETGLQCIFVSQFLGWNNEFLNNLQ